MTTTIVPNRPAEDGARAASSWTDANQRYLVAAIAALHRRLDRAEAGEPDAAAADAALRAAEAAVTAAAAAMPAPAAIDRLTATFGLSRFEREILLMCAAVDLDGAFAARLASAAANGRRPHPTFGLAMSVLPEPHWTALLPSAPLRLFRLIDVVGGDSLTSSALRIDERILHHLAGITCLDSRLTPMVDHIATPPIAAPSQAAEAERIARIAARGGNAIFQVCGVDADAKRAMAAAACGRLGIALYGICAADIPSSTEERDALARLWLREALLTGTALYVDVDDAESADARRAVLFLERLPGIVFVAAREPVSLRLRPAVRIDVSKPDVHEQRRLWDDALAPAAARFNGDVDRVAGVFNLGAHHIRAAAIEAMESIGDGEQADALWNACRRQARPRLDQLAQRVDSSSGWDDLVLPAPQLALLHQIAAHVRHRVTVYESWGFSRKGARGLGISALFSGVSGTGKTLAAEVLANDLQLDLYRIDLSQVVSKYIGETEKNLRRIFDAAEQGGTVLLFDEADALFGKRSEVKDSHDRYANIEVSYLLQRMEAYRGLAILTTNLKDAIDAAFLRRIRFTVDFPFPDATQRAEIWRRIFPRHTPTDGLDAGKLARLNVSGGHIYNIALNAAFLAADAGQPVRMPHLLAAARTECRKIERQMTDSEVEGWI